MEQAHERIAQWIKEGPEVLARLLDDHASSKTAFEEIQNQCARLRQERGALQAENEWLIKTQNELVDTVVAGLDLASEALRQFRKARAAGPGAPMKAQSEVTPAVPAIQGDTPTATPASAIRGDTLNATPTTPACRAIQPKEAEKPDPRRILVVDDDADFRSMLSEHLGDKPGCEARSAASGEEALMMLVKYQPQVVLLDVTMPGMGGIETLRRIKARYPALRVLMVTGLEERGLAQEALALGASDYLKKPFDLSYLDAFLEIYLSGDEAPADARPLAAAARDSDLGLAKVSMAR